MNDLAIAPSNITGLPERERALLTELNETYSRHKDKNKAKDKYYEGNITLGEVNLGIALPEGIRKLEVGCGWGAKAVDVLAARSMFDGFVDANGNDATEMDEIANANNLIPEYKKACRDELKYGCTFATLSADREMGCRIRFHSPLTAAALWDGSKGRIKCGIAVIDTAPDNDNLNWKPSIVNLYTDDSIWVLRRNSTLWTSERHPHSMGRPLMEPMVWDATSGKPFGQSRLKKPVREIINQYVRTMGDAAVGLEFATAPQKYLLGVTDEQYETVTSQKFRQYVGAIIAATQNPETGEKPTFGQLQQGSLSPHVEEIRMLATQFSAYTGLTVTDVGIVNDANPTSSDAILAQSQTLVNMAQELNTGNGNALKTIGMMAMAIKDGVTLDALSDTQTGIMAHFKNPAMPSVAVTADAAIKIASARQEFASTDVFMEMIGFDQADIRRIKAQEQRSRGMRFLEELENGDTDEDMGEVQGQAQVPGGSDNG